MQNQEADAVSEVKVTKTRRPKTKKRRVKKGLQVIMNCHGASHHIYITPKGSVVLAHHSDEELDTEMAIGAISGEGGDLEGMSRCARFLQAWRYANHNISTSVVPTTLYGVRPRDHYNVTGERVWRRYSKKKRYANRHVIRQWFKDEKELPDFLRIEFNRVGLNLTKQETYEAYSVYKCQLLKPMISKASNDSRPVLSVKCIKPGVFTMQSINVPGFSVRRYVNKTNFDTMMNILGRSVMASHMGQVEAHYKNAIDAKHRAELRSIVPDHNQEYDPSRLQLNLSYDGSSFLVSIERNLSDLKYFVKLLRDMNNALKMCDKGVERHRKKYDPNEDKFWK